MTTTTAQHTPGRWERVLIHATDGRQHEQIVSNGRGVLVIEHDGSPEGEANATLATSAPRLLAALVEWDEAMRAWERGGNREAPRVRIAHATMRAAIRQARGEEG